MYSLVRACAGDPTASRPPTLTTGLTTAAAAELRERGNDIDAYLQLVINS